MKKIIGMIVIVLVAIALAYVLNEYRNSKTTPVVSRMNETDAEETVTNDVALENEVVSEEEEEAEVVNAIPEEVAKEPDVFVETPENTVDTVEKAMNAVKADWGEDETAYFSYDGDTEEGEHIIKIMDKSTAKTYAWYIVDKNTYEFDIKYGM